MYLSVLLIIKSNCKIKNMIKQPQKFECFTDSSYSNQSLNKIGVIYIMIYLNQNLIFQNYKTSQNVKNSELQKIGIKLCIQKCQQINPKNDIIIYTDCQSALDTVQIPKNVELKWVKGHSKKSEKNEEDLKFKICDKKARKKMRQLSINE